MYFLSPGKTLALFYINNLTSDAKIEKRGKVEAKSRFSFIGTFVSVELNQLLGKYIFHLTGQNRPTGVVSYR